jgi:hypothetical protein
MSNNMRSLSTIDKSTVARFERESVIADKYYTTSSKPSLGGTPQVIGDLESSRSLELGVWSLGLHPNKRVNSDKIFSASG